MRDFDTAPSSGIDPCRVVITEPVRDSDIPVQLSYVELIDGVYAPIGLRRPPGNGPFPIVLFASGNGGGGMAVVLDFTQNRGWTPEQFLKAGYAVAWMRYRAEVDYAYDKIGKLVEDRRQNRQLLNRAGIRRRHFHRRIRQDAARYRSEPDRLHGYEPWRGNGLQDCVGIPRRAGDDRERASRPRILAAKAGCRRPHQSSDGLVGRRADADARHRDGSRQDHVGCRTPAEEHDPDADFRAGPQQRRAAGDFHGLPRAIGRARQGGAVENL